MSAALQLVKEGIRADIFERNRTGGMLWYANRVDNLLGHRGKTGRELCQLFSEHLVQMGVKVIFDEIQEVHEDDDRFSIRGNTYSHLIMASGTLPNRLGIPGELNFIEDPGEFKSERVIIVGGGDLALDNALRLDSSGARVTILYRNHIKANQKLQNEVANAGIEIIKGDPRDIEERNGTFFLSGTEFNALASFIGRKPDLHLIERYLPLEIIPPYYSTTVKGLYVVGDAALGTVSQTALASGSGIAAAMHIASMEKKR
jgi:thioredoxin reductase (NADPH)